MRNIFRGLIAMGILAGGAVGCQSKIYDENVALRNQNVELQQQLDDAHRQTTVVQAPVAPQPAPVAVQASAPMAPKAVEAVTPVAADPVAPSPKPDFGNLEVTSDPVAGTTTVNLPSDIFFASGQAVLLPDAKKSLTKVATILKKDYSAKPIKIEGYTDSDPIHKSHWKSNEELSEKRAEAVKAYLVSKGVSADRVSTEGLGDKNPKSKSDKAKNRRVELVVMSK